MPQTKIADYFDFRVDTEKLVVQLRSLIEEHTAFFDQRLSYYRWLYMGTAFCWLGGISLFLGAAIGYFPAYIAAVALGALALLGCLAFVGHRYLSLYKPEGWGVLVTTFAEACRAIMPYCDEVSDHHVFLASAYTLFAEHVRGKAATYFSIPYLPDCLKTYCLRFSEFCYHNDVHNLREILLKAALTQHLELVQRDPLNLTYHSQLASTYVLLSRLFLSEKLSESNIERFRHYATCAVAEFHIIAAYAPDDPWVYSQLAMSYCDLQLPHEEIRICEVLLKLCPSDAETQLRLGRLYFQIGDNAKGLHIYENLRTSHWKLAAKLITYYGAAS